MHIVITGGSSGIGFALGRLYGERGERVSLIARRSRALDQAVRCLRAGGIAADRLFTAAADVCDRAALGAAIDACEDRHGPVDILITCAGTVSPCPFDEQIPDEFDRHLHVNLHGTANAVRAVYGRMCQRGSGRIMMVSSGAALIGCPGYAAYCASKSALIGFAEALDLEAAPRGVCISLCFPPDTLTPRYADEIARRSREAARLMGRVKPWSADRVARRIVDGLDRGRKRVCFGTALSSLHLFGPVIKPVLFWLHARDQAATSRP